MLDLDYAEDSEAGVDGNFVMTGTGRLIEVQMSAEGATFTHAQMTRLIELADQGVVGISGIDTRALTRHLRERGAAHRLAYRVPAAACEVEREDGLVRYRLR